MARMTFEELNIALDRCIAAGEIYNVDFQDWKSYAATRTLEAELDACSKAYLAIPQDEREEADSDLYWARVGVSIMTFPSKKLVAAADVSNSEYSVAVRGIINKWTPVAEKFKTLKPMIVKGRKPSDTPRKTPERTLDNTGTCACCGQNVKLDNGGKIVNHGFTIRYGYQEGQCPAVGCDPIEVSTEGLLKFGEMLNRMLMSANSAALTLNARIHTTTDAEKMKALRGQVYQAERQVKWIGQDLAKVQERVVEWKSAPLPDEILKGKAA